MPISQTEGYFENPLHRFIEKPTLSGEKSRGKVTKFLEVTFSPIFFHLTKNLFRFFLCRIIIIISHLLAKFIITIFFMYFKHF